MPITPLHFFPAAALSISFYRWFNIPAFILVNIFIDIEPLTVMISGAAYPLHGYAHTLLIGSIIGAITGWIVYVTPSVWQKIHNYISIPYHTTLWRSLLSGITGAWLHIVLDSFLYTDIQPLYPSTENPLLYLMTHAQVYQFCKYSSVPLILMYVFIRLYQHKKKSRNKA